MRMRERERERERSKSCNVFVIECVCVCSNLQTFYRFSNLALPKSDLKRKIIPSNIIFFL